MDLEPIHQLSQGHYDWFFEEFESFTKRQELERAILKSADLLEKGDNEKNIHEVRQHVKELSTVLSLVFTVKPSDNLEMVIGGLNRSEMVIGEWHDKVVLAEALKRFLEQHRGAEENQMTRIRECHQNICEANSRQIESIIDDVRRAITEGMPSRIHGH